MRRARVERIHCRRWKGAEQMTATDDTRLRESVRARYAAAATAVTAGYGGGCGDGAAAGCCAPSESAGCCSSPGEGNKVDKSFGAGLYSDDERAVLPAEAIAAS